MSVGEEEYSVSIKIYYDLRSWTLLFNSQPLALSEGSSIEDSDLK